MSTSDPSPSDELASSPGPLGDPAPEDSAQEPKADAPDTPSAEVSVEAAAPLPAATEPQPRGKDWRDVVKKQLVVDASIFDVSIWDVPGDTPVETPLAKATSVEPPLVEQPVVEPSVVEPLVEAPSAELPVAQTPAARALAALAASDAQTSADPTRAERSIDEPSPLPALDAERSIDEPSPLPALDAERSIDERPPLPSLDAKPTAEDSPEPSDKAPLIDDDDDDEEAEWEVAEELTSVAQNEKPAEASAQTESRDRPWRDVDDLEDDENSEDLTDIVHKDPPAEGSAKVARPWRDVDDLEDDDDPSEYLPTQLMGVRAPSSSQRALVPPLVPPPTSRNAARSRAPLPVSLPAIPPPPTLPRSVPPSVPPVAFDWILERTGRRAGSLTVVLAGLVLLVVGILPLVVIGAFVAGPVKALFSSEGGSLVVTVAGANHGPVDSPVVVADDVPRCKESPCRITKLEPGTHFVRVTAPGYQPMAPRAVSVKEGGETVLHVELAREPARATVADRTPTPIDLDDPKVKVEALPKASRALASTPASESVRTSAAVGPRAAAPGPASGEPGTLNLSSTPPANVVLDGRPLGVTPRAGIKVKPGAHQVVFIHPKLGRKAARANVKPGGTSNVSVRFR